MKKIFLLLTAFAIICTSCSDDDTATNNSPQLMLLEKTIRYFPTKTAYESGIANSEKTVTYFQDNKPIADTTYTPLQAINHTTAYAYIADTKTVIYKNATGSFQKHIYQYDANKRLINYKIEPNNGNPIQNWAYTYTSSAITKSDAITGQSYGSTPLNGTGLIDGANYVTDRPVQFLSLATTGTLTVNLTYYDVTMPQNLLKTIPEINNLYLEKSLDERINVAENNNYYLKQYESLLSAGSESAVTFERAFNTSGYQTYFKATGTAFENDRTSETFFYYQ